MVWRKKTIKKKTKKTNEQKKNIYMHMDLVVYFAVRLSADYYHLSILRSISHTVVII